MKAPSLRKVYYYLISKEGDLVARLANEEEETRIPPLFHGLLIIFSFSSPNFDEGARNRCILIASGRTSLEFWGGFLGAMEREIIGSMPINLRDLSNKFWERQKSQKYVREKKRKKAI